MDFKDRLWNRDAYARLQGNLDPTKTRYGHYFGAVLAVAPNERVRELCGFEGFSATRLLRLEDGSYRKLLRETVFYRDPATGKLLDQWKNPWTGEIVKVVNVANDPFNFTIGEYYPDPPSYGGLNKEKPPKKPLLMDWRLIGPNTLGLTTDIHLFYPNALQPDKWPRESSGKMAQVSEMFRYIIRLEDMQNPELTSVPYQGTWNRVTPWLPWMLLGDKPGNVLYVGNMTAYDSLKYLPEDLIKYTEQHMPKFLEAPDKDYGPSLSSIENYAREQKPAPVRTPK
ncbi:MAG: DUF1838 family protein [Pseudomonadales bacterium]|nr:DUF1838 family protein [Pseudomonadales bacterium]